MRTFYFEKTSPSPTLPFCMKICSRITEALLFLEYFDQTRFRGNFCKFFKTSNVARQVDKICSRILCTWPCWHTCPGWYCNPQLLQPWTSTNSYTSPLPFLPEWFFRENFSVVFIKEKEFRNNAAHMHLTGLVIAYHDGNWGCNSSLSRAFFGVYAFVDGILGHNLLLSRAFSVGIPSWMGF
jgi:hypothetical protein